MLKRGGDFKASVPHISVLAAKRGGNVQLDSLEGWKTPRPSAARDQERAARGRGELQSWPHVCGYHHCQPNQAKQTLQLGERGGVGNSSLCPALRSSPWILHPVGHLWKLPCFRPLLPWPPLFMNSQQSNFDSPSSLLVPGLNGSPHVSCFLITWK